ncbi:MAG: galactose-1-phosphate uridylyltransferase [Terriglobia bacterium]
MPQLRLDPTTWLWIIAGEPAARQPARPPTDCPFCPTADATGELILLEKHNTEGAWTVRVLADRAPVLAIEGELDPRAEGLYDNMNAVGTHEIVVEGQAHDATLSTLAPGVLRQMLEAGRDRIHKLKGNPRLRYVEIFQNQGAEAAALISHPHAQIIGSPMVTTRVERELRAAHNHYLLKERCLYCDLIKQELKDQQRVVEASEDYLLLCPYASRVPYEMWLLPRRHHSSFEDHMSEPAALDAVAVAFHSALRRAEALTPALNFVLHTEPNRRIATWLREEWQTLSEDYHWHFEITPRLPRRKKTLPDQEFYLNQVLPEEAARHLRTL